ncbi:MAG: hypothetical protein RL398_596 [Planctomycetota bacterium]|jgi:hypothetical protein
MPRIRAVTPVVVLAFAGSVLGQVQQPQDPQAQPPSRGVQMDPSEFEEATRRDPLDPIWGRPLQQPQFAGFPSFAQGLFGGYPRAAEGELPVVPRLPILPAASGWPSWVRAASKEPLPNAPELALLVRHSDRVWRRERGDDPFTPLFYFEKMDGLVDGSEISVRQTGEFELIFYESGRLLSSGPADIRLGEMNESRVVVEIRRFTNLRFEGVGREHELRLPDGSVVLVPADPTEGPVPGKAILTFTPVTPPGAPVSRYGLFHGGDRPVRVRTAGGEIVLEQGHRIELLVAPPRDGARSLELATDGVVPVRRGAQVEVEGAPGGTVRWLGASFRTEAGTKLRLTPLQGDALVTPAAR